MATASANVPDEKSILCESCGYTLDGLPDGANCPECGKPASESIADDGRRACAWEKNPSLATFLITTLQVNIAPRNFFRKMFTRSSDNRAGVFGNIQVLIQSILFGCTAGFHWHWYYREILLQKQNGSEWWVGLVMTVISGISYLSINWLASKLTAWEARYRGIRLPLHVVRRGLKYHLASCLPVAFFALVTTAGFYYLRKTNRISPEYSTHYLYVLSGEVIIAAFYLFVTYWAAMKSMMYANR